VIGTTVETAHPAGAEQSDWDYADWLLSTWPFTTEGCNGDRRATRWRVGEAFKDGACVRPRWHFAA
jgi:hypothetical protein